MNRTLPLPALPSKKHARRALHREKDPAKRRTLSDTNAALLLLALRCLARLGLGAASALGIFGDGRAPFGAAFAAAGAAGLPGVFGVFGAAVGSFLLYRMTDGLKYTASTLLASVAVYAAGGTGIARRVWFRPLCAAGSLGIVGGVTLLGNGGGAAQAVMLLCEMILSAGVCAAWGLLFRRKQEAGSLRLRTAEAAAAATLMLGLSRFTLPGGFSPVRLAVLGLTLWAGSCGGYGLGTATGLVLGAAGAGQMGAAYFAVLCAFGGLGAGLLRQTGKSWSAGAFLLSLSAAALLGGPKPTALYEGVLATGVFLLLPRRLLPAFREENGAGSASVRTLATMERRLGELSGAVAALGAAVGTERTTPSDELPVIFERAAGRVCRKCALRSLCWDRDRKNTAAALRSLAEPLAARGRLEGKDLPPVLAARCLSAETLVSAIGEELRLWQTDRVCEARLAEQRRAVGEACAAVASLLPLSGETVTPAPEEQQRLDRALRSRGVDGGSQVWREKNGRLTAEICGRGLDRLISETAWLDAAAGVTFAPPVLRRESGRELLTLREQERLRMTVGVSCRRKAGAARSGDSGTWFRTPSGGLTVLLSDGMGSGGAAAGASQAAVRVLERFLRAEADPAGALSAANAALLLRDGGTATVDLCLLDPFLGTGELCKYGAGPTYLCGPGKLTRVCGENLPGGIQPGSEPFRRRFSLRGLSMIVLVTDGVSDGTADEWLRQLLREHRTAEPRTLAAKIIDTAWERTGGKDDMTAVCIGLSPRETAE